MFTVLVKFPKYIERDTTGNNVFIQCALQFVNRFYSILLFSYVTFIYTKGYIYQFRSTIKFLAFIQKRYALI